MKKLMKNIWTWIIGAGFFSLALFCGQILATRTLPESDDLILAKITRGSLEKTISCTGTLAAVGTVDVGAQVSGTIKEIRTDYNQKVGKGQILALLDPTLFEASVTEADGNLKKAETELALARAKDTRNKPLYAKGHISEEEYLPIRSAVKTAEAAVTATEAALKRARANLNYATIRSPINGTVIERSVEAGQTIAASLNTPTLFVIAEDLSRMQIKTNVDESDIGRVHENIPVRFTVQTHQGKTFTGRVTQIRLQPKTISNVVNYTVVVDAENGEGLLLPGMTATVDLVVGKAENVLLVANSALRFTPEQHEGSDQAHTGKKTELSSGSHNSPASSSLYILGNDGKPSRIMVHTGLSNDLMTEVDAAGELREDMVVIAGQKADKNQKKPKVSILPSPPGH